MNPIDKIKLKKLQELIDQKRKKNKENGKYSLFYSKKIDNIFFKYKNAKYSSIKDLYNMISSWDNRCKLSYEDGVSLDEISNDPNYTIAIHRTNLGLDNISKSNELKDIMTNGLTNYGHMNAFGGSGFIKSPHLGLTTSVFSGIDGYINLIASYKNNDAVIIFAFPSDIVNGELDIKKNHEQEIYNYDERYMYQATIKPEYIIGVLVKGKEGKLDKFYTREELLNIKKIT